MPHYLPYLILALVFVVLSLGILIREQRFFVVVIQISYAGMIYVFETVVMVMFDAYTYHPDIVDIPFTDGVIGAAVSNVFAVPAAAAFVVLYQLSLRWKVGLALFFGAVDWLFVQLDVYEHNWWNTFYSFAGIYIFFEIADLWTRRIYTVSPFYLFTAHLTYTFFLLASASYMVSLTGIRLFRIGLFEDPYRDDTFVTVMLSLLYAICIVCAIFWSNRRRWLAAAWIVIFGVQYAVLKLGFVQFYAKPWIHSVTFLTLILLISWLSIIGLRTMRDAGRYPIGRLGRTL